jgi:hypothetical protein
MFEFGKDLRKLLGEARDSDDLGWMELIGADLLAVEARALTTDGGRVSCRMPSRTWTRASAMWREHARRTGVRSSLDKALATAADALNATTQPEDAARAGLMAAMAWLTAFDLYGDRSALDEATHAARATRPKRLATLALSAAVHARIRTRQARLSGQTADRLDAAALMDAALHALIRHNPAEADELRLDGAALALEGGILQRDARLLDQAGRDLQSLVAACDPDTRPLTRARALALCGAGLSALAAMADDAGATATGHALFDAAADQFFPDHSPMDWAAVQVARAVDSETPIEALMQAEALTGGHGTVLGGLALDLLIQREIALAAANGDLMALTRIETRIRRRLAERLGRPGAVDWAVDQIAMARLMIARAELMGTEPDQAAFVLSEAAEAATDHGVPVLADRARRLILGLGLDVRA